MKKNGASLSFDVAASSKIIKSYQISNKFKSQWKKINPS